MGFWETILDPLSHSVTESLELHFSSQRKQELMCLHLGTWRLSEKTGTQLNLYLKAALMMNLLISQCECTSLKFRTHSQAPFITSQVVCKNVMPYQGKIYIPYVFPAVQPFILLINFALISASIREGARGRVTVTCKYFFGTLLCCCSLKLQLFSPDEWGA